MNDREASLYPFVDEAIDLISTYNMTIQDLNDNKYILERAVDRIRESLTVGIVSNKTNNPHIELMSFPVSIMFIRMIGQQHLARRFALAESERVYTSLVKQSQDSLIKFAENHLGFKEIETEIKEIDITTEWMKVHFTDYLDAGKDLFSDPKWKLVNRYVQHGYVYITKHEFSRLLKDKVGLVILGMLGERANMVLPPNIDKVYKELVTFYDGVKPEITVFTEVIEEKYPPCMNAILDKLRKSINLSHIERFSLTSFVLTVGMSVEDTIEMYHVSPDFREDLTRYQVEDIAGKEYVPPSCATMKTNHICCTGENKLCAKASHPLGYYAMSTWKPPKKTKKVK